MSLENLSDEGSGPTAEYLRGRAAEFSARQERQDLLDTLHRALPYRAVTTADIADGAITSSHLRESQHISFGYGVGSLAVSSTSTNNNSAGASALRLEDIDNLRRLFEAQSATRMPYAKVATAKQVNKPAAEKPIESDSISVARVLEF